MSVASTLTSHRAGSRASSSTIAKDQGSSPVEHPADHTRKRVRSGSRCSAGTSVVDIQSKWCGSRKNAVTLVVIALTSSPCSALCGSSRWRR
jgi:hypothetical protein